MSGCNATLRLAVEYSDDVHGVREVCCIGEAGKHGIHHFADDGNMAWTDDSPGAKPHTPPQPRFYLEWSATGRSWRLIDRELGDTVEPGAAPGCVASFYGQAGKAIANDVVNSLNGEDDGRDLHIYCRAAERARERERDKARLQRLEDVR